MFFFFFWGGVRAAAAEKERRVDDERLFFFNASSVASYSLSSTLFLASVHPLDDIFGVERTRSIASKVSRGKAKAKTKGERGDIK